MYYIPQPPFLVVILGAFIAVTFGTAFQNLLGEKLRASYENPKQGSSFRIGLADDSAIAVTFTGVCLGVWIFLGGGLLVLGFGFIPAYGVALLLTIFTAGLVWDQINQVLLQLKEGGSAALELE